MVFASLIFLFIFLPLNLLLYYSSKNTSWRNWVLIIFSLAFYSWGEPIWITLMIFSALIDYINALWIEKYRGTIWAKLGIVSTLIFNLGLLITFKYDVFIVENVNSLFGTSFTSPGYGRMADRLIAWGIFFKKLMAVGSNSCMGMADPPFNFRKSCCFETTA